MLLEFAEEELDLGLVLLDGVGVEGRGHGRDDGRRVAATASRRVVFNDGTFDGAISVSALQWLCYDNDAASSAPRRLNRFFASLYRCLRAGGRAALQFYPENDAQAALIAAAAQRAGFAGGVVVDFPRSTKARKHYLCLSTERRYRAPDARDAAGAPRRRGGGRKRGRDWVLDKKAHQRKKGGRVRPDSKFTGRKRKDKF